MHALAVAAPCLHAASWLAAMLFVFGATLLLLLRGVLDHHSNTAIAIPPEMPSGRDRYCGWGLFGLQCDWTSHWRWC